MSASAPPQQTFDTPSTPRPEAAKITFELPGCTAMDPTARPANCAARIGPRHESPPLVVKYRPTPAMQPLPHALGSPVPGHRVSEEASSGMWAGAETLLPSNES